MNVDEQIQLLIDNAPRMVLHPVVAAIAPGLKLLAGQFRHSQYILQNLDQDWV
jgi:hypothetical protein